MIKTRLIATSAVAFALMASAAAANEFEGTLRSLAEKQLAAMMADPAIVAAVRAQNEAHKGLTAAQIDAMDQTWRAEVGSGSSPTIDKVKNSPVSDMLREMVAKAEGLYTEIILMDDHGLNVAVSETTSDYWQGDEEKWQLTYAVGAGAVHIGEVELDESTQIYQSQISIPVVDPANGELIGAATFGVNVEALE